MNLSKTKSESTISEQKASYEARREQERKRRFGILSGNIKPIQITFHLKSGEHAYYQCPAQRMADKEYSQFYTSGKSKAPFIQGGLLRGSYQVSTETEQVRGTRSETVDNGTLLFTNKRILFVGAKQVVDIVYDDIIAVDFTSSSIIIKYPQMFSGESYACDSEEAELYYKGIQRLIGKDKSVVKLEDVQVDWPEYKEPDKKASGSNWYKSNVVSILLLFIFFPLGLFMMWKFTKWNKKVKWIVTGIGIFVYAIFVIGANSTPTKQSSVSQKAVPTKAQEKRKLTANVQVPTMTPTQAYIAQIMNIQFDQMDDDNSDMDNITTLGVSQVKSDIQTSLKTSKGILTTLQGMNVPQEMIQAHSSFLAGVNESINASNMFLSGLTDNSPSEIASAKNMFTQADADVAQGENLLYSYEQQQYGSFATMGFTFNGITIKDNFDVPIDCQIYMEASAKHWSIAWDYHEDMVSDSNNSLTIDPFKSKTLVWSHITDGNDQPTFNYPPTEPYDVALDCDIFNHVLSKQITQKMESQ